MSGLYIENTTLVGGLISRRLSQQLLKVFLTDTTMAVVFDDAFRDIELPELFARLSLPGKISFLVNRKMRDFAHPKQQPHPPTATSACHEVVSKFSY
ncbi:MAG: hypothetical protein WDO14_03470 [Bacteroidota bacterium]